MLDLHAGVHLEEVEAAVGVEQELHGAGVGVANRPCRGERRRRHLRAQAGRQRGAGCLLDDLLMPALDRTLALAEVDQMAVAVAEDLDLDVARPAEELLDVHPPVAEGRLRLARGGGERRAELLLAGDGAHALPAAPARGLDQHRVPERRDLAARGCDVGGHELRAGDERHARARHGRPRRELVAHGGDRLRRRSDPDETRGLDRLGEGGALGEEAVAGMDGVRAGRTGRAEQRLDVEIRLAGGWRSDGDRLVGGEHVGRATVGLGVDGNCAQARLAAGTCDPDGDLSAVGDEDGAHGDGGWSSGSGGGGQTGGRMARPARWRSNRPVRRSVLGLAAMRAAAAFDRRSIGGDGRDDDLPGPLT